MDTFADAVRIQEQNGRREGVEPGSLSWVRHIEEVKAGLRDDPGRAYSVEFTAAAEILREHDPVQFNSLRRLLKDKQVRLGEFDRLVEQRRRERVEDRKKRNRAVAAMGIPRTTGAIGRAPRTAGGGVQVGRYLANAQGLFLLKSVGRGAPHIKLPLANFTARIVTEIKRDDGVDSMREFEIQERLGGQTRRLMVAAAQFASMKWVTEQLGARAVIAAGMGIKDQVREAIQLLSAPQMAERTIYAHTGWRRLDGGWAYLHGGGALGTSGAVAGVETSLPAALAPLILPASPTGADLRNAIRASLAVLDLAPDRVTVPTLGAVWRSILGAADFSVFVHGATGRFKTALASLLQQHFGAGFAAHRLPGSWASTANFNEVLAFIAKDALLVIDDFRPGAGERRRLEGEADRLLRAAANGAGRGRLKSGTSLRPAHPPRALILATGEERPSGESLIARMLFVEVTPGDIGPKRLSARQRDAAGGLYAQAMAGYIQWLALRLDGVRAEMSAAHARYREQAAHAGLHRRTPGIVADLFIGWQRFLDFAHEAEALTRSEAEVYRARVWNALIKVAHRQLEHLQEANPVDRFLGLLRSAISTGHAHLTTRDGTAPADPGTCGWRTLRPRNHRRAGWLPQGARVGWLDGQDLLLDIDSAFHVAQTMAAEGDGIVVGVQTLVKRLREAAWLKSVDERRRQCCAAAVPAV